MHKERFRTVLVFSTSPPPISVQNGSVSGTVQNGSERFRTVQNGSERFRTVLNYLHVLELSTVQRTVQNGFLAHVLGLRCGTGFFSISKD